MIDSLDRICFQPLITAGNPDVASPAVRTFIESRLKYLLNKIGARVRFREGSANDERAAGELLSELIRYLNETSLIKKLDAKLFSELSASTFLVNYGSHDRPPSPVGLSIGDVGFALERMIAVEAGFVCPKCGKKLWQISNQNYQMQCKCGDLAIS